MSRQSFARRVRFAIGLGDEIERLPGLDPVTAIDAALDELADRGDYQWPGDIDDYPDDHHVVAAVAALQGCIEFTPTAPQDSEVFGRAAVPMMNMRTKAKGELDLGTKPRAKIHGYRSYIGDAVPDDNAPTKDYERKVAEAAAADVGSPESYYTREREMSDLHRTSVRENAGAVGMLNGKTFKVEFAK